MSARELLVQAREIIADETRWVQASPPGRSLGKHSQGEECAFTAVWRGGDCEFTEPVREAVRLLAEAMGGTDSETPMSKVMVWNDTHTHAEVIAAYDRAIEMAPVEEQERELVPA